MPALYVYLETLKGVRRGSRAAQATDAPRRALEEALGRGGHVSGWERLARRALAM